MKNKRTQQEKTKAKNKVSSAKKKTWAEIGQLSESVKTANKNFDEMEWTWPEAETLVSNASSNLNSVHPGEILKEDFLKPLKLTVEKAAKKMGIKKNDLSAILRKKANITLTTASKLAKAFKTSSLYWINMQNYYDATRSSVKVIERKNEDVNQTGSKNTALKQLTEFLNSKNPDLTSIKKEIANLKMIEEDQIKEAFKAGVTYGNGPQTFDYPESRYYWFTYGSPKQQ